jgi:hypothetical protein
LLASAIEIYPDTALAQEAKLQLERLRDLPVIALPDPEALGVR